MSDVFDDFEDDDAWDDEADLPDPEQVAIRLHEEQVRLLIFLDREERPWWDGLSDEEREIALAIGEGIVERLTNMADSIERVARWIQDYRHDLDSQVSAFDDLEGGERKLLFDLLFLVQAQLIKEGSL